VVGPADIIADIGLVGLTNVVCRLGIAQQAVAQALTAPTGTTTSPQPPQPGRNAPQSCSTSSLTTPASAQTAGGRYW
jgi:hypothetical protein